MMVEENETRVGVAGGLDPNDGRELKWEDTVVPSDDFSDDVSDEGTGTGAKDGYGVASSYFVFALLGLLASVAVGFAYFQFVSPSGNVGELEAAPKAFAGSNARAELGAVSDQPLVLSHLPNHTTNSPTPVYKNTGVSSSADKELYVGDDAVMLPVSLSYSGGEVGESQIKRVSTEVADLAVLPVPVLLGNDRGASVSGGRFSPPKYDPSGFSQKISDKPVTRVGEDVGDRQQVEGLVLIPPLITDKGESVKSDLPMVEEGVDKNSSRANPPAESYAPKIVVQERQDPISAVPQGRLASSNLLKNEMRSLGGSKNIRGKLIVGDTIALKQTNKTDVRPRHSYVLRSATAQSAWIENATSPGLLRQVTIGDTIPEFGRVMAIVREGDGWVVVGKGVVLR